MRVFALIIAIAMWSECALASDPASLAFQQQAEKDYRDASEYLWRDGTISDVSKDYNEAVRYVFREAFAPDVRVRVLSVPSVGRESVVGIKEREGIYTVFWVEPKIQLWGYGLLEMFKNRQILSVRDGRSTNAEEIGRLEAELPGVVDVRTSRCERTMEPEAARRAVRIWESMIGQARPGSAFGLDGESYEFALDNSGSLAVASAWSPYKGSRGDLLVKVVEGLKRVCINGSPLGFLYRRQLNAALSALEMRLDN